MPGFLIRNACGLDRRSAATAAGLAKPGVSRGDVVAILLHDRPELLEAMSAVSRLGAVFMPIN